jgi:serine/threonine protein kinase
LEEVFQERGEILLVLELMEGDINKVQIDENEILKILRDVLLSLKEMHRRGIVHFDIRPGRNY